MEIGKKVVFCGRRPWLDGVTKWFSTTYGVMPFDTDNITKSMLSPLLLQAGIPIDKLQDLLFNPAVMHDSKLLSREYPGLKDAVPGRAIDDLSMAANDGDLAILYILAILRQGHVAVVTENWRVANALRKEYIVLHDTSISSEHGSHQIDAHFSQARAILAAEGWRAHRPLTIIAGSPGSGRHVFANSLYAALDGISRTLLDVEPTLTDNLTNMLEDYEQIPIEQAELFAKPTANKFLHDAAFVRAWISANVHDNIHSILILPSDVVVDDAVRIWIARPLNKSDAITRDAQDELDWLVVNSGSKEQLSTAAHRVADAIKNGVAKAGGYLDTSKL